MLRGTINQIATPDELRGQVSAVNSVFVVGGTQVSALSGGLGALLVGLGVALVPSVRRFTLPGDRNLGRLIDIGGPS